MASPPPTPPFAGVSELSTLRDVASTSLKEEEGELAGAVKNAAREEALLTEQHSAIAHALAKLTDYIGNIELNLPSNPSSPRASLIKAVDTALTPNTAEQDKTRKQLFTEVGGESPTRVDSLTLEGPDQMSALPSKEVLATPYAAAHKYLARHESANLDLDTVKTSSQADLEKISNQILSEQNHPLFNPDLKVGESSQTGWFGRTRTIETLSL